jgi:hypothetical protein
MKKIIRLTESDLHNIISRCVSTFLSEDGEGSAMGGGATNCGGLMVGSSDESGGVTYPAFGGKVQKRQIYNAKGKGKSKTNQVDMSDALKRHNGKGGSISINNLWQ